MHAVDSRGTSLAIFVERKRYRFAFPAEKVDDDEDDEDNPATDCAENGGEAGFRMTAAVDVVACPGGSVGFTTVACVGPFGRGFSAGNCSWFIGGGGCFLSCCIGGGRFGHTWWAR